MPNMNLFNDTNLRYRSISYKLPQKSKFHLLHLFYTFVCMHVCALCVYVHECVCVYSVLLELMGTWEQMDVNTITSNPIQTLQRPSLTTISGDRVAKIFTARYARLPTQALFQNTRFNHTTQAHTHTHTNTHTHSHVHTQHIQNTHRHACTKAHTQSISK